MRSFKRSRDPRFAEKMADVVGLYLDPPAHAVVLWLNAVETFFSALTRQRIRRGSFQSIVSLQAAINRYLDERNAEPRPFIWTASAASILAKLARLPVASE